MKIVLGLMLPFCWRIEIWTILIFLSLLCGVVSCIGLEHIDAVATSHRWNKRVAIALFFRSSSRKGDDSTIDEFWLIRMKVDFCWFGVFSIFKKLGLFLAVTRSFSFHLSSSWWDGSSIPIIRMKMGRKFISLLTMDRVTKGSHWLMLKMVPVKNCFAHSFIVMHNMPTNFHCAPCKI